MHDIVLLQEMHIVNVSQILSYINIIIISAMFVKVI